MSKGITIDLIVDPKGAVTGINTATGEADKANSVFSKLGKAGTVAVAAVATAAAAAAAGMAAATVSAAAYADEILTAATNTNLSTDQLQAYKYAAEQIDVSFETFTSSQGKLVKSMAMARTGTGEAADAFSSLGLSVTDSSGNLVDSTELYWASIDALGKVSNETERTALAQQIFGKSGAEMNSLIAKGADGFAELTAQAKANGAVMSGSQLAALGAFDDKMQSLTSTVSAAKNALGLTLLPILDQLAGDGSSALGEFTSALLVADGDLTKAGPAFESLGSNIAGALTTAIPKILEVGSSLITGLVQGIVANAPSLVMTALPLVASFVTGILGMLPTILDAGLKLLVALVQGISAALPTLIPAAVTAIIGLVDALIVNLPMLLNAGIQLLLGLAVGIVSALPLLLEKLPEVISALVIGIVSATPQLVEAGLLLFLALVGNLPAIIEGIVAAAPAIIAALTGAFTSHLGDMANAGLQLIRGLWEGIQGQAGWLWGRVSGFFGGVIDNIKNLFGIHSPSTVFAGFGNFMIQGLEQGLTGPNRLGSIMSDLSGQVTNGFSGELAVNARATMRAQSAVTDGAPGVSQASPPQQITVQNYMLPEQDPRVAGRQFGREFGRALAGAT